MLGTYMTRHRHHLAQSLVQSIVVIVIEIIAIVLRLSGAHTDFPTALGEAAKSRS